MFRLSYRFSSKSHSSKKLIKCSSLDEAATSWSSLVEGGEGSYLPKPSPPSTKELHGYVKLFHPAMNCLNMKQLLLTVEFVNAFVSHSHQRAF